MVKIRNPINNEIKRWIISLFLRMICFCPPASNAFQLLSDLFGGWYNKSHGTGPKKTGELYGEFSRLGDFLALFFIADPQVSDLTKTRRIQWKLGKRPKLGSKKNYIRCFIWCFFWRLELGNLDVLLLLTTDDFWEKKGYFLSNIWISSVLSTWNFNGVHHSSWAFFVFLSKHTGNINQSLFVHFTWANHPMVLSLNLKPLDHLGGQKTTSSLQKHPFEISRYGFLMALVTSDSVALTYQL